MVKSGMCSVTFRDKTPEEIIDLVVEAGLDGIEWGADKHVPPTDLENAKRVGQLTRAAGLEVASYGSYYFAFDRPGDPLADFTPEIDAAIALGASVIRIWAGSFAIEKTPEYFRAVAGQSRAFAEAAQAAGIKIAYEFHANTFTETLEGTLKLIEAVNHPNLYTYWQPPHGSGLEQRLEELATLKDRLLNLHVFHWTSNPEPHTRLPLAEGSKAWNTCLAAADESGTERYALLEFVRDDDPGQFLQDAATLKRGLLT
ncbi:MAG: sugar phosphate isomerase/epimerase family protein [Verrucomicrobiota bacterium]|nr:sugar phosphate isomerase/epimerase family protein [Verrucomicrobiota bacterium]